MSFENKVAIITGAASGIGLLTAQCLAKDGAKVVLTDINEDAVTEATKQIRDQSGDAMGLAVDIREYEQVKATVKKHWKNTVESTSCTTVQAVHPHVCSITANPFTNNPSKSSTGVLM